MATLTPAERTALAKAVLKARRIVTAGVIDALQRLAVERHEPHGTMSVDERHLRNDLRARGRQLGDVHDGARGTQKIDRLTEVVAYELWHRMFFARVLAENGFLFDVDGDGRRGVILSIDDIRNRAMDDGRTWPDVAAAYAQRGLPQVFRTDDPALRVRLAYDVMQDLEDILDNVRFEGIPEATYTSDDGLGWVYQYWQAERKGAINDIGGSIGADDLPAVTQLFTEDYMVWFLLHNTLGAWWAGKVLARTPGLAQTAPDEATVRRACALPGVTWEYLRFVQEDGAWRPAAGTFPDWPTSVREVTVLDPCMGSGHFLTFALPIVAALRTAELGEDAGTAVAGAVRDNLFGLELDARCAQIAAFNLALTAWRLGGYGQLPQLNLACTGLSSQTDVNQWESLQLSDYRQKEALKNIQRLFSQAEYLGSLIEPNIIGDALGIYANFDEISVIFKNNEKNSQDDHEIRVKALGIIQAARFLTRKYSLVITNPPFLGSDSFNSVLREYCNQVYPEARFDLAFVFFQRIWKLLELGGSIGIVIPQTMFSLKRQATLRGDFLNKRTLHMAAPLGTNAFSAISGEVVNVTLCVASNHAPSTNSSFSAYTERVSKDPAQKALELQITELLQLSQKRQLHNIDNVVIFANVAGEYIIRDYAKSWHGFVTGDNNRFYVSFWEHNGINDDWIYAFDSSKTSTYYGGRSNLLRWEKGEGALHKGKATNFTPKHLLSTRGVLMSCIGKIRVTEFSGGVFDANSCVITVTNPQDFSALYLYMQTEQFQEELRKHIQKPSIAPGYFLRVPYEAALWRDRSLKEFPNGFPNPFTNDPTQWLFHGHPFGTVVWDEATKWTATGPMRTDGVALQIAVARLLGYRWPAEYDASMHLASEQRAWVDRCADLTGHADADGIVCLPSVRGEEPAATRLGRLLGQAYGPGWSAAVLADLVRAAGTKSGDLGEWLRDAFFEDHCKTFENRPFIWHIWDGLADGTGFSALVNYHRLAGPGDEGYRTLQALTYTYLGDWIDRQRAAANQGVPGADARRAAAERLQAQLDLILQGEAPYDLFVRWKPLHEQAIGWYPDIDDGVRMNIRPFMTAQLPGAKKPGLLRFTALSIGSGKDGGNDVARPMADFPWSWGAEGGETDFFGRAQVGPESGFNGKRWNDLHYTLGTKRSARARRAGV